MPRDETIIERLAEASSPEEAIMPFLFHGSGKILEGPLRPGGYDGVFWTAGTPAIAQCYIPRSGMKTMIDIPGHRLEERIRPAIGDSAYEAALQMSGGIPEVDWDSMGMARSWTIPGNWPRYSELLVWFRDEMGYPDARPDKPFWTLSESDGRGTRFLRGDYRLPGSLSVLDGRGLNFYDHAQGREGDLQEPDHNRIGLFRRAERAGYDGIVINDFCQSANWGNVGHLAWGVFPSGIPKLRWATIPATNFDWPEDGGLAETVTPEFRDAWEDARMAVPGGMTP